MTAAVEKAALAIVQDAAARHGATLDPTPDRGQVPPKDRVEQLRGRMLSSDDLDALPPPEPLLDGVLYRDSLVELWGRPGCGKSFLAVDWALCVATGKQWQGHPVRQGRVLYIVGEGLAGLGKRRRAWSYAWQRPDTCGITWLRGAVPFMEPGWIEALADVCAADAYDLIVVDTLSRSIAGHNENAAETMSAVVASADRIREVTRGACVMFVHHATKEGATNRGHSALEGACDVRWQLQRESGALVLSNGKSKDDAEAPDQLLRLRTVEVTHSGRVETSCVIESQTGVPARDETTEQEAHLLRLMWDSFGTTGASGTQLKEASGLPPSSHYRAVNALLSRGALLNTGTQKRQHLVLPGTGQSR